MEALTQKISLHKIEWSYVYQLLWMLMVSNWPKTSEYREEDKTPNFCMWKTFQRMQILERRQDA